MKKIVRIARLELSIMFYSPIAWLVLVLFIIQTGITFTELLYSQETNQQLGRPLNVLTKVLFAGEDGILAKVQRTLYLYIPILTMGLFSREISSGSIKLLLTSPVTSLQIILGKYLSMLVYGFILSLILATFIFTGAISIEAIDVKFVLGGILGVFLLIAAYSAIGLYMSSLTSYQVVAAVSTLAILAVLNFIGTVGQEYDFIRDITYWFSISGRTDHLVNGLISSKDIVYFILVIVLFLGLVFLKLNDERKNSSTLIKIGRYALLIVAITTLGYYSSLPLFNKYYDTTRFKDRTLTENSKKLIDRLEAPINITSYVNLVHYSAQYGSPKNRIKDLSRFEMYRRFIPEMKMKYITYYDTVPYRDTTKTLLEKAKTAASVYKINFNDVLTPEQIRAKINLAPENNRLVRFVEYKGKTTPLRMFDDMFVYPNEAEISVAIKRLLDGPSQIGFLANNLERSINSLDNNGYKIITNGTNIRGSLINQGFNPIHIDLNTVEQIPDSLKALVIADPKKAYSESEKLKILNYINTGGNLLITTEPSNYKYLNPILDSLGLAINKGVLLQESENHQLDLVQAKFTPEAKKFGFSFYENAVIATPTTSGISIKDTSKFKINTILKSNKDLVWNRTTPFDLETQQVKFDTLTDIRVEVPIAVALERTINNKNQKIMVVADADLLSNAEMARNNLTTVNSSFAIRTFKWLNDGIYPVSTARKKAIDKVIKVSRTQILWIKAIYLAILPFIIACIGLIILMRRKRN
ncbi:Gldg family protein [Lutibacter sp. A64]|uniref:Gldg family protein n=1 Tax=Lutibacter sp. A64 TaxID=2918526 RepID=UPI001F05B0A9|nr:Gldg family protein [Lutibacter sp. A64]UMB55453.1 Gldg family protein [Lutibacter sp. A64]